MTSGPWIPGPDDWDPAKVAEACDAIVAACRPIFAGKSPTVQGAALADLVAIWVAGHQDTEARANMIALHTQTVCRLVEMYVRAQAAPDRS